MAYAMPGQYKTVYSTMSNELGEARSKADQLKSEGAHVVIMKNLGMDDSANGNYKWEVLKEYQGKGVVAAMIFRDPKFWIVAVLILVATYFLAKSRTPLAVSR